MRRPLCRVLRPFLLATFLSLSTETVAGEFHLLELDELSFEGSRFGDNRDPMTPWYSQDEYTGRAALRWDVRLLEFFYWKNYLHTEGVSSRVATVGWQWDFGLHLHKNVDLFYQHHSRHVTDTEQPQWYDEEAGTLRRQKFPVEDAYGVRLRFYTNEKPARSLFR